jgi:hypothetical protein
MGKTWGRAAPVDRPRAGGTLVIVEAHDSLIGPDETAYRLELTPAELKLTYTALKSLLNDFGHDEYDVQQIIRSVLDKLPPGPSIESIDLNLPRGRRRL